MSKHRSGSFSTEATLVRLISSATFLLCLSTWKLWWPTDAFPRVPLLAFATGWPAWVDGVFTILWLITLASAGMLAGRSAWSRRFLAASLGCLLLLMLADQHRAQPWAYHFALTAWVLVCRPNPSSIPWLRALLVSVYLYSAFSKLDARFLTTNGSHFVTAAIQLLGMEVERWSSQSLSRLAVLLPLGELATGLALAWPRLRRVGVLLAAVQHATLLLLLSPLGLNHRWGVLIWNVAFLMQVVWLFGWTATNGNGSMRVEPRDPAVARNPSGSLASRACLLPVCIALGMPILEPWGYWDSWLSWGLYSVRSPQAEMFVARQRIADLPLSVQAYCESPDPGSIWARVSLDRWSLDTMQAPLHPHPRFQLGVVSAVASRLPNDDFPLMIRLADRPDRWTGTVEWRQYFGVGELGVLLRGFRLNARPRTGFVRTSSGFAGWRGSARLAGWGLP
jgi:hypothetical protein